MPQTLASSFAEFLRQPKVKDQLVRGVLAPHRIPGIADRRSYFFVSKGISTQSTAARLASCYLKDVVA